MGICSALSKIQSFHIKGLKIDKWNDSGCWFDSYKFLIISLALKGTGINEKGFPVTSYAGNMNMSAMEYIGYLIDN